MPYKEMYKLLFCATAKVIDILLDAHQQIDKMILEADGDPVKLLPQQQPESEEP